MDHSNQQQLFHWTTRAYCHSCLIAPANENNQKTCQESTEKFINNKTDCKRKVCFNSKFDALDTANAIPCWGATVDTKNKEI